MTLGTQVYTVETKKKVVSRFEKKNSRLDLVDCVFFQDILCERASHLVRLTVTWTVLQNSDLLGCFWKLALLILYQYQVQLSSRMLSSNHT
jgi:hypothetical protein